MCVWVVTFEMFVLKHMNESLLWSFETHKFGALQGTEKYSREIATEKHLGTANKSMTNKIQSGTRVKKHFISGIRYFACKSLHIYKIIIPEVFMYTA